MEAGPCEEHSGLDGKEVVDQKSRGYHEVRIALRSVPSLLPFWQEVAILPVPTNVDYSVAPDPRPPVDRSHGEGSGIPSEQSYGAVGGESARSLSANS